MKREDFILLEPGVYRLFHQYSQLRKSASCESCWSNLLLYMDTYRWHCLIEAERMWIVSFDAGYIFYPLGREVPPEELADQLKRFRECLQSSFALGDVPPDYHLRYPQAAEVLALECDPGEADYIYDLEHLHGFSGGKLRKRHNQVRQFDRQYSGMYQVAEVDEKNLPDILRLSAGLSSEYWADDSGLEEKLAMSRLPELWQNTDCALQGITLWVRDALAGFAVCGKASDDTAVVHFEKADHAYRGCGAKVTAELVEFLLQKGFSKMNREQDLNDPGLRRAKQALDPEYLFCRKSVICG